MKLDLEKKIKLVAYWSKGSETDFQTAKAIFSRAERYPASLFFLHLAIEKALKSKFVEHKNEYAPFTHNLLVIAERIDAVIPPEIGFTLSEINSFNMETRYPDEKEEFEALATKEFAEKFLSEGEKVLKWILSL